MRKNLLFCMFFLVLLVAKAQDNYKSLPPIRVDGNQLVDASGNKVVLHGVMDTPSPWFNSNRWGSSSTDGNVSSCITYFNRLFTAITDSTQGAYCNLFRLHLDPCWTNDNSVNAKGFTSSNGKTYDPLGNEVGGEADIHHYSGTRLTKYLKTLYTRIAIKAMDHGLYVIMRPPGVCPGDIQVGTYYQDYLIDVWDRVTKNDTILKYYGHIGIELANEPVRIRNANGQESGDQRFHDFFQPIVDKIRANGFKGIIWVPGGIWQQEYRPYAKYPIEDPLNNLGYAVHDYPGWYGLSDNSHDAQVGIQKFGESIPVVRTNPVVITEIDWSPYKPGTGHYNESGAWVESNYGTWATASTSKWGNAFKQTHDYYGNVSMTLSGTDTYLDWNTLKNSNYTKVSPAFPGVTEACGETCFIWYAEWAKQNYPSKERYQEYVVPENPFEFSDAWFNPHILYEGTASHRGTFSYVNLKKGGCSGWRFDAPEGYDLSSNQYLNVNIMKAVTSKLYLRIYDNSNNANYFGDYAEYELTGKKKVQIDLHDMTSKAGNKLDPAHIRIVGFNSPDVDQQVVVTSLTLEGSVADGIANIGEADNYSESIYSPSGAKINQLQRGINIVRKNDGSIVKVLVK